MTSAAMETTWCKLRILNRLARKVLRFTNAFFHPWEICRGGNSTHISLFVSENNGQWAIRLAGSSNSRVEETARMAVALHQNNIPFELSDAEEIVRMITGTDYIRIIRDHFVPCYCHHLFPREDRIIDFINLHSGDE